MSRPYEGIVELAGARPGPSLTVLAGVHGNELPGILALRRLMRRPPLLARGRLTMLFGNPRAILLGRRQTERNLNRLLRDDLTRGERQSYEYSRACLIRQYLDNSDLCLDLHASSTPGSPVFAISERPAFPLLTRLPVRKVVTNIDPFEPGSTDGYMNSRGKIGICVECGYLGDKSAADLAELCVWNLLDELDMIERLPPRISSLQFIQADNMLPRRKLELYTVTGIYKNRAKEFRLTRAYRDFQPVSPDEIIAKDGDLRVSFAYPFHVLFAQDRDRPGEECFLQLQKELKACPPLLPAPLPRGVWRPDCCRES